MRYLRSLVSITKYWRPEIFASILLLRRCHGLRGESPRALKAEHTVSLVCSMSTCRSYMEKGRAFLRLQDEIIKNRDDQSIFAWSMDTNKVSGLLTPQPKAGSSKLTPQSGNIALRYGLKVPNNGGRPSDQATTVPPEAVVCHRIMALLSPS